MNDSDQKTEERGKEEENSQKGKQGYQEGEQTTNQTKTYPTMPQTDVRVGRVRDHFTNISRIVIVHMHFHVFLRKKNATQKNEETKSENEEFLSFLTLSTLIDPSFSSLFFTLSSHLALSTTSVFSSLLSLPSSCLPFYSLSPSFRLLSLSLALVRTIHRRHRI